jgi:hypothetical protein
MRKKAGVPFEERFPRADPRARALLRRLLAFDPADRPSAGGLTHAHARGTGRGMK